MTIIEKTRPSGRGARSGLMWLLYVCDTGLLVTSGLIHLHLWDIAYRHVKTLDVLFLVQVVLCLLARSVGIFGFKLTFSSGLAYTVLIVEAAAVVLLAVTAWLQLGQRRRR